MPRKRQRGRPDLSGPTGRALRGQGGGTTGQGMTENLGKYTPLKKKSASEIPKVRSVKESRAVKKRKG